MKQLHTRAKVLFSSDGCCLRERGETGTRARYLPDAGASHNGQPAYRELSTLDGRAQRGWVLAVGPDSITVLDF